MSLLLLLLAAIFVFAVVLVVTYLTYRRLYDNLQVQAESAQRQSRSRQDCPKVSQFWQRTVDNNQPQPSRDDGSCHRRDSRMPSPRRWPPLRQITLPAVPTRHLTFQRQLSHRLDLSTTVPFEGN
ncbi:hypothetical protein MRX96_036748 [Rhipicephalus microplus]